MKLNVKSLILVLGTGVVFTLTGCGGGSSTPTEEPPATEINYTGTDGSPRVAALTPGDAEVLANEGYQHTLFDTAEKKCQHCHNELFDSWKSSMHAKSWSDKIFQSKHQDFLRTHIAKIGASNDVTYTTNTFKNVGKTCAKCHAPASIYSDDFNLTIEEVTDVEYADLNTSDWSSLKASLEDNTISDTDYTPHEPTTVASIGKDGKLYKATYHIGHENNREGINCATCHSIETVRMMSDKTYTKDGVAGTGGDAGSYTLAAGVRGNVIGPVVEGADAGESLTYDSDASDGNMNIFFKLVGPEKYHDVANSPHATTEYDVNKASDGRYTFRGIDKNGTDGKTHYTGGPFYGPFGVTGLDNSNEDDDTNRSAQVNPYYDIDDNNHFGNNGKALCLSCHQRSAGAIVPSGADQGDFMELCSTWNAVSNGTDTNYNDSLTSPKCQKCHMPRVNEEFVLHQWAQPTTLFTQADMHLTPHFDPDDTTTTDEDNPVKGKWMNDHAFVGANNMGAPNFKAKIQSGFESSMDAQAGVGSIYVNTTLNNKTAHMFPGAHPMRRILTRVTVTDSNNIEQNLTSALGKSNFDDIINSVVTGDATDTINITGDTTVEVQYDSERTITYQGKTPDLNFHEVTSQKFSGDTYTIAATDDGTIVNQYTDGTTIKGTVTNAEIVESSDMSNFTRIYGRETGKKYDVDSDPDTPAVFIVRPGFDSNIVPSNHDNRLQPNESETYYLTYDELPEGEYTVNYKVYYMQVGANGKFDPSNPKLRITEVASHSETVTVSTPDLQ